ncbi:MAG: hypothetical protein ACW98F_02535 [Candidatus Hodarchaeales archaeon]
MKIKSEYFSIESKIIGSIKEYNDVIFNEDMSQCLIGDSNDWNKGIRVVKPNKNYNLNDLKDYEKKLVRLIVITEKKKKEQIVLLVNSILGVVTNTEEGLSLIHQLYQTSKARLSKFDNTNVFITPT